MKTLRSKLTVVFAFFAVVALAFGIAFMPKQASAAVDTSTGFYIEDGASIRTEVGESGIKWTAHISETKYAELNTEANSVVAIGIAIQPQGNTDSKLDIHYEYGYDSFEIAFSEEGDFEYSYAIYYDDLIADIETIKGDLDTDAEKEYLLKAYQTELEARPFVKHADGTYTYGEYFDTARSLQGVAVGTLVAGTYAEGSAEDTLLKSFLPNGYELADTEYVADSYYSNYDAWGNIAIDSAIPMANATPADEDSRATTRVYYRGNDVTDAYNPATGLLELTAEDKVSTSITTDGSANEYLVIYDEVTGIAYKQSFVGVTLAINDVADFEYFKLKSTVYWVGIEKEGYTRWSWNFTDINDYRWDGYYVLLNDIDATGYTHNLPNGKAINIENNNSLDFTTNVYGSYMDYLANYTGFKISETERHGFSGTFDGLGHTISNMNTDKTGLLGHIVGGKIKNLGMDNWTCGSAAGRLAYSITRYGSLQDIFCNTSANSTGGSYYGPIVSTIGPTVYDIKNVVVYDNATYNSIVDWAYNIGSLTGDFERQKTNQAVPFGPDGGTSLKSFDSYYVVSNKALIESIPANADPATGKVVLFDAEYIDGVKNETVYNFTYKDNNTKQITAQPGTRRYTSIAEFKKDAKNLDLSSFDTKYWTIIDGIPRFISTLKLNDFVVTLNDSSVYNVENNQTFTIGATYEGVAVPNVTASIVSGEGATLNGLDLTVTKVGAVVINVQGATLSKNITINVNPEIIETEKEYSFSAVDGLFFDDNFNVVSLSTVFEDIDNVTNVVDHNGKTLTISEDGALLGMDTSAKDWQAGYVIFYTADAGYKVFLNVAELIIDEVNDLSYFTLKSAISGGLIPVEGEAEFDGYYILAKDIDATATADNHYYHNFSGTSGFAGTFDNAKAYTKEGGALEGKYLTGTFDGNNHVIKNLIFKDGTATIGGLFGIINNGTIKNVGLVFNSYYYYSAATGATKSSAATHSKDSGYLARYIVNDSTIENVYIYDGNAHNADTFALLAYAIDSTSSVTKTFINWTSTTTGNGGGLVVGNVDEAKVALKDVIYMHKGPSVQGNHFNYDKLDLYEKGADIETATAVKTAMWSPHADADAGYLDGDKTSSTHNFVYYPWGFTAYDIVNTYDAYKTGTSTKVGPYEITLLDGVRRYTSTDTLKNDLLNGGYSFASWDSDIWEMYDGDVLLTSQKDYAVSAAIDGNAVSDNSEYITTKGESITATITHPTGVIHNLPNVKVISGAEVISVNGNVITANAIGNAVIMITYGASKTWTINLTVDKALVPYEQELQFSAYDGLIFNGENVVAVSDIVTDNTYSKITDANGNELTLSEGKILGITTSTKDWEENQIQFHYEDYILIVNVKVAELIIDGKEDFEFFTVKEACDYGATTANVWTFAEGDFAWKGFYVLAKNIDATGYTHSVLNGKANRSNLLSHDGSRIDYYGNTGIKVSVPVHGFMGTFDGQGYAITNLNTGEDGLFGALGGATIKNVAFINCSTSVVGSIAYATTRLENIFYTSNNKAKPNSTPLITSISYTTYNVSNVVVYDNTPDYGSYSYSYGDGSWTYDTRKWHTGASYTFGKNNTSEIALDNLILISSKAMSRQWAANSTTWTESMDAEYIDGVLNTNTYSIVYASTTATINPIKGVQRFTSQKALTDNIGTISAQLNQLTDTGLFTVSADGVIGWANA